MVSDVPKLPYLFSTFVLVPLLQVNKINIADVKWTDPSEEDDDCLQFDAFYQVGACIVQHFHKQTDSWDAAEKAFKDSVGKDFNKFVARVDKQDILGQLSESKVPTNANIEAIL